jgi:hypothetical protein
MFTNAVNALPISEKERRTYVAQCPATPRAADYYKRLYATLHDRDFLAAVWTWLATRDLSRYNPGERAPLTAAKERMAEDNRTDEQQRAVDFARAAPFEVILSTDLIEMLAPVVTMAAPTPGGKRTTKVVDVRESGKERATRINAITRALQDIEVCTANRKIFIEGKPTRVWILRNADSWRGASAAKLREAVEQTRRELALHGWKIVLAMEAWKPDDEPSLAAPNPMEGQ